MFRTIAFTALVLGLLGVAQADVYRWVDAQGRVHYTDRWVPGSQLVKVDKNKQNPEMAAARQATNQSKIAASNTAIADQQAQANAAQTVQQDIARNREEQCKQVTERYAKAVQARRIFKSDKDGVKEYVSDAEADAYRAKLLLEKQTLCGGGAK